MGILMNHGTILRFILISRMVLVLTIVAGGRTEVE
jgi:hypothetical protein